MSFDMLSLSFDLTCIEILLCNYDAIINIPNQDRIFYLIVNLEAYSQTFFKCKND